MKDTHYQIDIKFVVSPEIIVEDTTIPQRAAYQAKMVRGPFLGSKDAAEFQQKGWQSPAVLEWPSPSAEPLEIMRSDDALLEVLELIVETLRAERQKEIEAEGQEELPLAEGGDA